MSDREFENYLTLIGRLLRLSSAQREVIGEELRDHFESRLAELTARGVSHAEAVRIALEEFGDAAGLAAQFSRISSQRKRRMIMRCTVASVGLLAAVVIVATSIWPEHRGTVIGKAVAESSDKGAAEVDKSKLEKLEKAAEELPDDLNAKTEAVLNTFASIVTQDSPTPLKDVLDALAGMHKLQIYIDQQALKDTGIDPSATLVALNLKDVHLRTALDLMLSEWNLGYTLRDGLIIVSSKDKLAQELETRVYDCREILSATPITFHESPTSMKEQKQEAVSEDKGSHPTSGTLSVQRDRRSPVDDLIEVIVTTIEPQGWNEQGGPGTICEYDGLLVVSQTSHVHSKVATLLDQIQNRLANRPLKKQEQSDASVKPQ